MTKLKGTESVEKELEELEKRDKNTAKMVKEFLNFVDKTENIPRGYTFSIIPSNPSVQEGFVSIVLPKTTMVNMAAKPEVIEPLDLLWVSIIELAVQGFLIAKSQGKVNDYLSAYSAAVQTMAQQFDLADKQGDNWGRER